MICVKPKVYRLDASELCGVVQEASKRRINNREAALDELRQKKTPRPERCGMPCYIVQACFVVNSGVINWLILLHFDKSGTMNGSQCLCLTISGDIDCP